MTTKDGLREHIADAAHEQAQPHSNPQRFVPHTELWVCSSPWGQLRLWYATPWGYAILWFLASRVWLIGATALGARLSWPSVLGQPDRVPLWQTWRRWDADIYAHIATHGYVLPEAHTTPAFFPLYPLAERLLAPFFGGDAYLAGMLIANAAWFVALVALYRLTQADFGQAAARGAVLALSVFPTALFGFVAYPEALFLALAIASLRQMRQRRWLRAALLGMLAALTRQAGVLLILPFLWEAFASAQHPSPPASIAHHLASSLLLRRICDLRWPACSVLLAFVIPLGTALFAVWLWRAVGDPLAFWHAQATWHRTIAPPWQTLWLGFRAIGTQPSRYFTLRAAQEWLTVVGMGVLAVLALRRAPRSYSVFAIPLYLLFLVQLNPPWPLLSQGRFMLEVFPSFCVLGALGARHRWLRLGVVAVGVPVQIALISVFAHGGWVI